MEKFNASLSYDKRMWKEDIQVGLINLLLCLFGFFVEFGNFFIHLDILLCWLINCANIL